MRIINLGSRIVNTYLIELKHGWLLIDTGYPEGFRSFMRKLRKHKIDPNDIKFVFLTHAHDDHAGFLNELLGCCDAKVIVSEQAVEGLRRGQNCFDGGCTTRLSLCFCRLMKLFGKGKHNFPPVANIYEHRYISNIAGCVLNEDLPGQIIETPGHTNCSISLLLDNGLLFCGDAAMNGFPSTYRMTIWAEDIDAYTSSWKKIIQLQPIMIYPGHGNPFPVSDMKRYLPKIQHAKLLPLK